MSCKECERLRRKLSPKEDPDFTTSYKIVEPIDWIRGNCLTTRNRIDTVVVSTKKLFHAAFGHEGNNRDLMILGRSLRALGWEQTKRGGLQFYTMTLEEFDNEYTK